MDKDNAYRTLARQHSFPNIEIQDTVNKGIAMVRVITQETYDEVVNENMEQFSMTPKEAIEDAVKQFEAQVFRFVYFCFYNLEICEKRLFICYEVYCKLYNVSFRRIIKILMLFNI